MFAQALEFLAASGFLDLVGSLFEMTPQQSSILGAATLLSTLTLGLAFAGYIALLTWVARDARERGLEGAPVWVFLVMSTLFVGLLVYLFARPSSHSELEVESIPDVASNPDMASTSFPRATLEVAQGAVP